MDAYTAAAAIWIGQWKIDTHPSGDAMAIGVSGGLKPC